MANTTTLNETLRSPIDLTEYVRLATPGANWKAQLSSIANIKLLADSNSYVSATGSDSNGGTNSSTDAWATLQHAMNFIAANVDGSGFNVSVNIGVGTFSGLGSKKLKNIIFLVFTGAGTSTLIDVGPNDGVFNFGECFSQNVKNTTIICFDKVSFSPSTVPAIGSVFTQYTQSHILLYNGITGVGNGIQFDATHCAGCDLILQYYGIIADLGTITVIGGGAHLFDIFNLNNACLYLQNAKWAISGALDFAVQGGQLVLAKLGAKMVVDNFNNNVASPQWTGSATGTRFIIQDTASIAGNVGVETLGPTFFPGSVAGICSPAGSYDGTPGALPDPNIQTGASYTLVATDLFNRIEMNNAGANTLTVPLDTAFILFAAALGVSSLSKAEIKVTQTGAGATTIAGAVGVTVHNAGVVGGQWDTVTLYWRGQNEWVQTSA